MKKIIFAIAMMAGTMNASAQNILFTKTGTINFNSTTTNTVDKVEAVNKSAVCKLNTTTGDLDFAVLIKSFVFSNNLMQQHFNENYMQSDKFPKSSFKGKITNIASVNFAKDGSYPVMVEGTMSLHGVDNKIKEKGTITIKGGKASINSTIMMPLAAYKIDIPSVAKDKISKDIRTVINCNLEVFKK
jgi:hypothetical protein